MLRPRAVGLLGALLSTVALFGCGETSPTEPVDSLLTIVPGSGTAPAAGALTFAPNQSVSVLNITATNPTTMTDEAGRLVTWSYAASSPYVLQNLSVVFLVASSEVTTISYSYNDSAVTQQWNSGSLAILSGVTLSQSGSGGRLTLTNRTLQVVLGGAGLAGITVSGTLDY